MPTGDQLQRCRYCEWDQTEFDCDCERSRTCEKRAWAQQDPRTGPYAGGGSGRAQGGDKRNKPEERTAPRGVRHVHILEILNAKASYSESEAIFGHLNNCAECYQKLLRYVPALNGNGAKGNAAAEHPLIPKSLLRLVEACEK